MGAQLVVSIDPGLRELGIAVFEGSVLVKAGLIVNPEQVKRGPEAWRKMAAATQAWLLDNAPPVNVLVLEGQQVYAPGQQKGNQSDILELAGICGALVGMCGADKYVSYLPAKWKGQVPKDIFHARIPKKLTAAELAAIGASIKNKDVSHAIGVGLYHTGRLGR